METKENTTEKAKKIKKIKTKKLIIKIVIIAISILIFFTTLILIDKNTKIFEGNLSSFFEIETSNRQEEKAIKAAEKKFKELGEDIDKKDLEILKIQRNGEVYYYISAKENTVEVREKDSKITRINSDPVE